MENNKRFELIEARKRKNLTQIEVAEYLGIHQTTYSRLENGNHKLDLDRAKKLSKYLRVSINNL